MINVGSRLILGFSGYSPEDEDLRQIRDYLRENLIGGVILFAYNIHSPQQVTELIRGFYEASFPNKPLIALDQEGGRVQRLNSKNGFHDFLSAKQIALSLTPQQAYEKYKAMAAIIKAAGFNLNFGPVVDLEYEKPSGQPCPVIGALERSYGIDVEDVILYARAFVEAHRQQGVLTSLKHYPGHGFAAYDSHKGLVDITNTYRTMEELPFRELIQEGGADMVMVAHLMNRQIDDNYPASLSPAILKKLRAYYDGVTVSDDLHMGAIIQNFSLEDVLQQTLRAGMDLLVFSNNSKATGGVKDFQQSLALVDKIHRIISELRQKHQELEECLKVSDERLTRLKKKL